MVSFLQPNGGAAVVAAALLLAVTSTTTTTEVASFQPSPSSFVGSKVLTTSSSSKSLPPSSLSSSWVLLRSTTASSSSTLNTASGDMLANISSRSSITPVGYGFSSPVSRVLSQSGKAGGESSGGYYKASLTDLVTNVMEGITTSSGDDAGAADVALVFDDKGQVAGIFTETDYIKFSMERSKAASSEEESAKYLVSPVKDYITPADDIVALGKAATASVAITEMESAGVRHLVVADIVSDNNRLVPESKILGVLSMQDLMSVVHEDEQSSLQSLARKYPGIASPLERMRQGMRSEANAAAKNPETVKMDIIKYGTLVLSFSALALFFSGSPWLHDHAQIVMIGIFVLGYIGIIFEEVFEFNKAAVALLMSTGLWVTYADYYQSTGVASESTIAQLAEQLAEVSDICFFLLAASTIVEVVDAHQGFKVVTNQIKTKSKKTLFWTIGFLTFFLSAILNNLTVTIVMCSLLRKLVPNDSDRKLFGAMVVVAANAGGVWTPIGDVTTTMLWINNQLSTIPTVTELFLPSLVCLVASLAFLVGQVEEDNSLAESTLPEPTELAPRGKFVFWSGIASLLCVPVFAELTGLPPYLAMLTGLGAMWTLTDVIHMGEEGDESLKVPEALSKLDTAGILFFLGILMSIGVLDKSGLLKDLAVYLSDNLPSLDIIATVIGLASALIDNVPLVAATMGMYDLSDYGTDDRLWQLIALCAGTGGSILVIGSASGVALMGLEKVDFLWYTKKVSIGAAVGYFSGIATYLVQNAITSGTLLNLLPQAAVAADMVQTTAMSMPM